MSGWTVAVVNEEAAEELRALSADLRGKFERIVNLIKVKGLEQVHEPYIKHLEGKLWEMRMIGREHRAIDLRDGQWTARRCAAHLRQEAGQDAKARS